MANAVGGGPGVVAETLARAGYNNAAIAGLLGNFQVESGFRPSVRNRIGAFGLAQWLGGRRDALIRRYGAHPSLQQEANFVVSELSPGGPFAHVGQLLHHASSPTQAAYLVNQQYEISGMAAETARESAASHFYRSLSTGALHSVGAIHPPPPPIPPGQVSAGKLTRAQRIKMFDYLVSTSRKYNPGQLNWAKALVNDLRNAGWNIPLVKPNTAGVNFYRSVLARGKSSPQIDRALTKVYRQYAKGQPSIDPGPHGTTPGGPSLKDAITAIPRALTNGLKDVLGWIAKPLENAAIVIFGALFVLLGLIMLAHSGGASVPGTTEVIVPPSRGRGGAGRAAESEGGGAELAEAAAV